MTTAAERDAKVAAAHAAVDALAALVPVVVNPPPVDPPPVDPPPVDPPPVVTPGLIPTAGSAFSSQQFGHGPADWVDMSKVLPDPPWSVYSDPESKTFAPSNNGVRPTKWMRLAPWGNAVPLYGAVPLYRNGRVEQYIAYRTSQQGELKKYAAAIRLADPPHGPRGKCVVDPFTTWHGHRTLASPTAVDNPKDGAKTNPRMPLYIGVRMDGAMQALMRDGSIHTMGVLDGISAALDWTYFRPNLVPPSVSGHDDTKIFFVCDTYNGRIIKVDRTNAAAAQVRPALEDYKLWTVTNFVTGLGEVTSIRCTEDGTMYACDNSRHKVYKITPEGVVSTFAIITNPFFIDYRADGRLVVLTSNNSGVYIIEKNGAVGSNLTPVDKFRSLTFGTVSVDRHGTIGPVDDMYVCRTHGVANVDLWRFSGSTFSDDPFPISGGTPGELAHYPWVFECHPDEGILLAQGIANDFPSIVRSVLPSDPAPDFDDHNLYRHGQSIIEAGTVAGKFGTQPSFTALLNSFGGSNIGCSADAIAEMIGYPADYSKLAAFLRQGMVGSFPRPELVGRDLDALGYAILKMSQRLLKEGGTLTAGWHAWVKAQYPNAPVTQPPFVPNSETAVYVNVVGGKIVGQDKYGNGKTLASNAVFRVVADKGMPFEKVIGTLSSPWTLPALGLTAGPHALTCDLVSGGDATYVNRTTLIEAP